MVLKAKSSDTDESSNDEDSKMKSYIIRQFKKFMKNANTKGFDKNQKQSNSSQFKSQDPKPMSNPRLAHSYSELRSPSNVSS